MSYDYTVGDDSSCIHGGVECEFNRDGEGNPICPCRCPDCQFEEYELDDEYDAPLELDEE